jgi:hypothetical protein
MRGKGNLLWLTRVIIWSILAPFVRIVASHMDSVLKWILVAVDDCCYIRKYRLDLRLLVFVVSWSTQKLKCSCIVPINIRVDTVCVRHNPGIIVGVINFSLGPVPIVLLTVVISVKKCSDFVQCRCICTRSFRWYIGSGWNDIVRRLLTRELGIRYRDGRDGSRGSRR